MSEKKQKEEKFYTPEEVAVAVLKKTHELLKASSLYKANTSHEVEAGEEPHNDEAEAPEYLANADIENSGAHGEKKKKSKPGIEGADKDGDGDIDGDDAIEAQEDETGEDLDGDGEVGEEKQEEPDQDDQIDAAAKAPASADKKDPKAAIKAASEEKAEPKEKPAMPMKDKKPPFAKSENMQKDLNSGASSAMMSEKPKASLKKFMLARKMKKSGGPTADERIGEKLSGAAPAPSPAEKVKAQPKLQMEKNKSVEKLMGIKPKAGK